MDTIYVARHLGDTDLTEEQERKETFALTSYLTGINGIRALGRHAAYPAWPLTTPTHRLPVVAAVTR